MVFDPLKAGARAIKLKDADIDEYQLTQGYNDEQDNNLQIVGPKKKNKKKKKGQRLFRWALAPEPPSRNPDAQAGSFPTQPAPVALGQSTSGTINNYFQLLLGCNSGQPGAGFKTQHFQGTNYDFYDNADSEDSDHLLPSPKRAHQRPDRRRRVRKYRSEDSQDEDFRDGASGARKPRRRTERAAEKHHSPVRVEVESDSSGKPDSSKNGPEKASRPAARKTKKQKKAAREPKETAESGKEEQDAGDERDHSTTGMSVPCQERLAGRKKLVKGHCDGEEEQSGSNDASAPEPEVEEPSSDEGAGKRSDEQVGKKNDEGTTKTDSDDGLGIEELPSDEDGDKQQLSDCTSCGEGKGDEG